MSFGIQLADSNEKCVVDENFAVAELVESGTWSVPSIVPNTTGQVERYFSTSYPENGLWLALYLNVGFYVNFAGWVYSGGLVSGCTIGQWNSGGATQNINYRVYRPLYPTSPLDAHGILVSDPNGRIVFETGRKYSFVADFISPNVPSVTSTSSAFTSHQYAPSGWYLVSRYKNGGVYYQPGCGGLYSSDTPYFTILVYRMYNTTTLESRWVVTGCIPAYVTGLPSVATAGGVYPLAELI